MSSIRRVLRVFLASPGDLTEERKAIRRVVDEYNDSLADHFGYQIELLGWEDTVAGYGRPQHIINEEVDRCDLFLGMIWRRWGTPPDQNGRFSSGFQEEYERSVARRERTKRPDISLFIKHVPDDLIADPGDDLKRVLEFRENLISEKSSYLKASLTHGISRCSYESALTHTSYESKKPTNLLSLDGLPPDALNQTRIRTQLKRDLIVLLYRRKVLHFLRTW